MCPCPTPFFGHLRASLAYALAMMASLGSAPAALTETYHLPLFVSETTFGQQGVLRVLNLSDYSGIVEVHAIDDLGIRSGPATLAFDALETLEFDAADLASGGLGPFADDVRLEFDTDLRIEFLAYLRSADGALVAIHDEIQVEVDAGFEYLVPIFNPATNMAHESRLRLVNPGNQTARVGIEARDDTGAIATGDGVQLTLPAGGAMSLTAQQLEAGDPSITGQIGAGSGRWVLKVSSDQSIRVVNLLRSSTGELNNLSTAAFDGGAIPDASPDFSAAATPGDQRYLVNAPIVSLSLPAASGGEGALTYTLAPEVPGLIFDTATRVLSGTPTEVGTHTMTFVVTDADGDTDTLTFTITIEAPGGESTDTCQVGLLLSQGEHCTYPDTTDDFSVDEDGQGSFLVVTSARAINVNSVTFQGTYYDFRASHQGNGVWRIDRIAGSTEAPMNPPTGGDSMPAFAADASPGDQSYTLGTAIATLTLPEASGGDGTLVYSLSPVVPGLTFNPATRQLSGTPTTVGTHAMTYSVVDEDGDAARLSFSINVQMTPSTGGGSAPTFVSDAGPRDHSYPAGTVIETFTLPEATGGDGALSYSLWPLVPGLTFNPVSRQLSGTPIAVGARAMTYTATDQDGDAATLSFSINVLNTPSTEPRFVRLLYVRPSDIPYRQEVVDAMKFTIKRTQEFYAEQMQMHGHGNRVFQIETDEAGEPFVHRVDLPQPDSFYLAGGVMDLPSFPDPHIQFMVREGSVRATSGGLNSKRSGGAEVIPVLVLEQGNPQTSRSDFPYTLIHELGHAFGLPHDWRSGEYVMSYGEPSNRLSKCAADYLSIHPYFNNETPIELTSTPTVDLVSSRAYASGATSVPIELQVSDPDGIHQVMVLSQGGVWQCRKMDGEREVPLEFDYDAWGSGDPPGRRGVQAWSLSDLLVHTIEVIAVDAAGDFGELNFRLFDDATERYLIGELEVDDTVNAIIEAMEISPDGTLLASASWIGVQLWDLNEQARITLLEPRGRDFSAAVLAFSTDGGMLATAGRGGITLWDMASRTVISKLAQGLWTTSLKFSPDDAMLASGHLDGEFRLWDMATRTELAMIDAHDHSHISSLSFSPDGTTLVSATPDYLDVVKLWDIASRKSIADTWWGEAPAIFSPNGQMLAFRSEINRIRLWDVAAWTELAVLNGHESTVIDLSFSPDGSLLASASYDGTARLWDVANGSEIVALFGGQEITELSLSPNGQMLATGSNDGKIRLWDISSISAREFDDDH